MKNEAMKFSEFDVLPKHKSIIVFKLSKLWAFKHFFNNGEIYDELLDYYNNDLYCFEFKSIATRNNGSRSWSDMASTTSWWRI